MEMINNILSCPFCKSTLTKKGGSLICGGERHHCFDIAKSGYVSLTQASGTSGDDKQTVRARTEFLDKGHYKKFAEALSEEIFSADSKAPTVIDAGCGEGYYTNYFAKKGACIYGFDLSKFACDKGARRAKSEQNNAFFGVSSVFELPIKDECADVIISLFAPIAEKEFTRVLKPGGLLILGAAGVNHLYELKKAVYENAYQNEGRRDLPEKLDLKKEKKITYKFTASKEELESLFLMTPYAFKTSISDKEKISRIESLEITADFDIFVYQKAIM